MDKWNFHGYVALPLEVYSKECKLKYNADRIEAGEFISSMIDIMKIKGCDVSEFQKKYKSFENKSFSDIGEEYAKMIFEEFKCIMLKQL